MSHIHLLVLTVIHIIVHYFILPARYPGTIKFRGWELEINQKNLIGKLLLFRGKVIFLKVMVSLFNLIFKIIFSCIS